MMVRRKVPRPRVPMTMYVTDSFLLVAQINSPGFSISERNLPLIYDICYYVLHVRTNWRRDGERGLVVKGEGGSTIVNVKHMQ